MIRIPPILVVSVFGAIAAFAILQVRFSTSLYEMLPRDLPEVRGMDQLNRYFGRDGQLMVTVKAEESYLAGEAILSLSGHLQSRDDLVSEVFRELSLTDLVTEGGGLIAWLWLNAPPETFEALNTRLAAGRSEAVVANSMETLQSGFFDQDTVVTSYDPLGFSRLGAVFGAADQADSSPDPMASPDGTFQVMYVEGAGVDFSNYREAAVWLKSIRKTVEQWEAEWLDSQESGVAVAIGLTGTPAFMAEVGAAMERDMTLSVAVTILLISLLFWVMHRRTRPLSWLVSAMLAILAVTILIGGWFFGHLSVMSAGFAAILMGLAVDYGIIVYREAMDSGGDGKALRRAVGPSILWAAATTAVVFLSLNLSSLPGITEMGNLVAMGVMIGAFVMLYAFAPIAVQFNRDAVQKPGVELTGYGITRKAAGVLAILVPLLAVLSALVKEMPHLEENFHPFRIRESPSMVAWRDLQSELRERENAIPTIITGSSISALRENLVEAEARFIEAVDSGLISEYVLPSTFIPNPQHQSGNAIEIKNLIGEQKRLVGEIENAGFSEEGAELTQTVFNAWSLYLEELRRHDFALPTGKLAEWSVNRLFASRDGSFAALATLKPVLPRDRSWVAAVCNDSTAVASLGSLGTALNERIREDLYRVFLPMMGLLSLMLIVVFRSWKDVVLSLFSLGFAGAGMVLLTVWTPLAWNSFNICGLPLLFGIGLDFSIHMIFALRRSGGDVTRARRGIGKALLFCGTSSAIGFGSLATASAHGLASLGIVCSAGILVNMLVAVWLLPRWYRWIHRLKEEA